MALRWWARGRAAGWAGRDEVRPVTSTLGLGCKRTKPHLARPGFPHACKFEAVPRRGQVAHRELGSVTRRLAQLTRIIGASCATCSNMRNRVRPPGAAYPQILRYWAHEKLRCPTTGWRSCVALRLTIISCSPSSIAPADVCLTLALSVPSHAAPAFGGAKHIRSRRPTHVSHWHSAFRLTWRLPLEARNRSRLVKLPTFCRIHCVASAMNVRDASVAFTTSVRWHLVVYGTSCTHAREPASNVYTNIGARRGSRGSKPPGRGGRR